MKIVSVFDISISDYNLGNDIIMDAVWGHLEDLLPNAFFYRLPYMEITWHTQKIIKSSDLVLWGGGNLLSSNMERNSSWGINLRNCWSIRNTVLMGIGWWQYQKGVNLYSKTLLKQVLSDKLQHSVRDKYTAAKLSEAGVQNTLHTSCPSTWNLTAQHCRSIGQKKSDSVVFTLTDYSKDSRRDTAIINTLCNNYKNIFFWPQGVRDLDYLHSLGNHKSVHLLSPSVMAFTKYLSDNNSDYIGTRLHAGILSLQNKKRSLIIGIDNRATEMMNDINLPVLEQAKLDKLESRIHTEEPVQINIPEDNILKWKSQFKIYQ